jgi:pimeloyl-ACP methyl ester carboxylesterase
MASTATPRRRRRLVLVIAGLVYLALVIASNLFQSARPESPPTRPHVQVQEQRATGAGDRSIRVAYLDWSPHPEAHTPAPTGADRPAVILLHGSPGDASNFAAGGLPGTPADQDLPGLGTLLAARGYRVIAPDLPGFGDSEKSIPEYSILAHARYTLALMDALGIDRAHVVGWSMGGGVALHMADLAPGRVATATLMASIGTQESEGSGDYFFEHFKYGVGYAACVVGRDLLPHFGLLGPRSFWHGWFRNFLDTDQRPLRRILEQTRVPLLVVHGRYDVLAGVRGAEEAAEISPASRLVITGDNHFLPIAQQREMDALLGGFFARHDAPGRPPLPGVANLAPAPVKRGASAFLLRLGGAAASLHWAVTAAAIALLASRRPRAALMLAALLIDTMTLDFGVAAVGLLAGWLWKERRERTPGGVARLVLWVVVALLLALIAASQLGTPVVERFSWLGLALFVVGGATLLAILPHLWTWRGRRRLLASWSRLLHHEWWPASVFYAPLWPWWAWLSLRHGGPLAFTAANPGIPGGGGLIGESKSQILDSVGEPGRAFVLPVRLIEPGPPAEQRTARALDAIRASAPAEMGAASGGDFQFPVILKPDQAFRGFAMKLARTEADVAAYFLSVTGPVILQKYHPGPEECGLFWVRDPAAPPGGPAGRLFAVTRKTFPVIEGDGRRTLERLILDHPRFRCQWRVFFTRHASRLGEVLPKGQRLRLAQAGNHAQGTLFTDGADLITPELSRVIDAICDSYRGPGGHPYDFGRMDVRYESDELLRQGRAFGIVEMNGSTSEATNLYDPSFSPLRSYSILFAQWKILYELGAWRRAHGFRGVTLREIARHWMAYRRQRSGSSVAD